MNKKTNNEAKLTIVPTKKLEVSLLRKGKGRVESRYVHTIGKISSEQFAKLMNIDHSQILAMIDKIVELVHCGYEVRLGKNEKDGVRFFPLMHTDYKSLYIHSQTMGSFRHSIDDMDAVMKRKGVVVSDSETDGDVNANKIERENRQRQRIEKEQMICVTPDTMVKCPRCNLSFRVGKVLGNK